MKRILPVLLAAFAWNCSDSVASLGPGAIRSQLGTLKLTAIDSAGATVTVVGMNENAIVTGKMVVNGSVEGFTWKSGQFTMLKPAGGFTPAAINDNGDLAGASGGVPAIWMSGQASPAAMFRPDTTLGQIFIASMNTRGEVLFGAPGNTVWVWRSGVAKRVQWEIGNVCSPTGINNQGVVMGSRCTDLYHWWELADSPFGVTRVDSRKLAGQTCVPTSPGHGVVDNGVAVNDSNEALLSVHWTTPAGCEEFKEQLTAFDSRGLIASYVGGGATSPKAMLHLQGDSLAVDQLLDSTTAIGWRVQSVKRLTNGGAMWASALRLSDGKGVPVLLTPSGK